MAGHFAYTFDAALIRHGQAQEDGHYEGPLLDEVVAEAQKDIETIEAFQTLPERNRKLILRMTAFAINEADRTIDRWRKNFWGLYIVGSRASGQERANSDLDLLSVGTFYRQ